MTEYVELEFHIEPATPKSIPAKELLDIVNTWVKVLGEDDSVRFHEVRDGCACPVVTIKKDVFPKVQENLKKPESHDRLNKVLAKNKKHGFIKTANDNTPFDRIDLLGIKQKQDTITIYDETQIKGKIISIHGKDATVNIDVLGTSGEIYKCKISYREAENMSWGQWIDADISGDWVLLENDTWDTPPRQRLTIDRYNVIQMYDAETVLDKMSGIISQDTYDKIQAEIALDKKEAE